MFQPRSDLFLTCTAILFSTLMLQAADGPAEARKGFQPLKAALHVHSRVSDGEYEIHDLAAMAQQRGVDVLGLSDSFQTRVSYGVPPFRKLISRTISRPGVVDYGIERYFNEIQKAQDTVPGIILLPGVEVTPEYYWRGSWPGSLELYDFDRHLLIWGLVDNTVLKNLPVIQNERWANTPRDWGTAVAPAVVWLIGLLFASVALASRNRRPYYIAIPLFIIAIFWTYDEYPFGHLSDPYRGEPDSVASQRLINDVDRHGGLAYWSYPEAKYADVEFSGSKMISRGQPQVLGTTQAYRGFEGLYGDTITITEPGALWDQLLVSFTAGERRNWPSVVTGIDFHSFKPGNGWYSLDQGLTILFARTKTAADVLDALRTGRDYATFQNTADHVLLLEDFALRSANGEAITGETVESDGEVDFTASLRWTPADTIHQADNKARIRVIQDGRLIDDAATSLPRLLNRRFRLDYGKHYFRLIAEAGVTKILSNPIFCNVVSN